MVVFSLPTRIVLSGLSMCGKTTFAKEFIKRRSKLCDQKFERILWCFSEANACPQDLDEEVQFHRGIPDDEMLESWNGHSLLILDDLQGSENSQIMNLFTKKSHHFNLTVIYIQQTLFNRSPYARTIQLNSQYLVLFKQPRDASQIMYLARYNILTYVTKFAHLLNFSFMLQTSHATQSCSITKRIYTGRKRRVWLFSNGLLPDNTRLSKIFY